MGHEVAVLTVPKDRLPVTAGRPIPEGVKIVEIGLPEVFYRLRALHKKRFQAPATGTRKPSDGPSLITRLALRLDDYRLRKGIFSTVRMPDATDLWIRPALRWGRNAGTWDLVISSSGPYATHLIGASLKKSGSARFWVADYRDLWTDSHNCTGVFPITLIEKRLERWAMKQADLLTTVSTPLANTLATKYRPERVEVIENGFDSIDFKELPPESIFPADGRIRIVYTGTVYKGRQDPRQLFAAIARLAGTDSNASLLDRLEVIFCGTSTPDVMDAIEKYGVARWVRHVGLLPRSDALRMQRDAHALLFLEWDQGEIDGILTGKLYEYLYSGTPIWGIGVTEKTATGRLIQEAKAGMLFGNDGGKLAAELLRLLASGKKEIVRPPTDVLAPFERGSLAKRLLDSVNRRMSHQTLS
jgi:hypothetical protein